MPVPRITMFHSYIAPRARALVDEVLQSGWINEGTVVQEFEARLSDVLGLIRPATVNSGTAALHLALALTPIGSGDEVIIPSQTFVASGTVVLMLGGVPVFADIDPRTGNLDPKSVERAMTPRTRAIMAVHWGGYPCDLDELDRIAADARITLIEDAAHALGARYRDRPIGAISRFTAFSFQSIKHLTTGDGGALCCRDEADARAAVAGRWFGIDRRESRPNAVGARDYDIRTIGFKYHMNNIAAALGLGNLEDFPARLGRRRAIAARYRTALAMVSGIELLEAAPDRAHAYWLFTMLVERRDDFVRHMAGRGIQTSVVDFGIDRNSIFAAFRRELPGQRAFDAQQVSLPVHEGLDDSDVAEVLAAVRAGW